MGVLVWNNSDARSDLASLRAFAEHPDNTYRPGPGAPVPGDDPRYRRFIPYQDPAPNCLRVVYTITLGPDRIAYRHLSLSANRGDPPIPLVEELVLPALGFRGRLANCVVGQAEGDDAAVFVVAQPVAGASA